MPLLSLPAASALPTLLAQSAALRGGAQRGAGEQQRLAVSQGKA